MSKIPYKEFSKQAALLAEYNKLSDEEKDKTILLAADLDKDGFMSDNQLKHYAISQYDYLNLYFASIPEKYKCYYELLKLNEFCKVYFDIDGLKNEENDKKVEYFLENFHRDFINFWKFMKTTTEGGCPVLRDHNADKDIIPKNMVVYASSNSKKISYHVLFPDIIMQNNYHCGAVDRRFELWALDHFGENLKENPYFFIKEKGDYDYILDRGVYTPNRIFRLLFNSKSVAIYER